MRSLFLTVAVALLHSPLLHALPCQVASLQSYLDLGAEGCDVEDKLFSDFLDLGGSSGASPIPAADVLVTPISTPGNPGLTFDFGVTADAGELLSSSFSFSVAVLPGGLPIQAVSSSLSGSGIAGDGANTLLLCPGTSDPTCPVPDPILLFDIGAISLLADSRTLTPTMAVDLVFDLVVDGGLSGSASLSSAAVRFREGTAVSEPTLWLAVGTGFLALGRIGRRSRSLPKEMVQ